MAKIEFTHPDNENYPSFTETVEARIWGRGGAGDQVFYIGSGLNFQADANFWLEVIYSVEGAPVFYTRNIFQHFPNLSEERLDEIIKQGEGVFGFGDMLPETSLTLSLEKRSFTEHDEEKQYSDCTLKISCDSGAVFGRTSPGMRSVDINLIDIEVKDGERFMRELIGEIKLAYQGKHPDPASFPQGSSEWQFLWQLNQRSYNKLSEKYQENYFEDPLLTEIFDDWLAKLPAGGHVLDAGCGHGDPVIRRLLEKGFQVTGSDFSPDMLRRASRQFPQANFLQKTTTTLADRAVYDGVCSFNSTLYLDPVDLLNSILRIHDALKPGGLLFLYGFDAGPGWRGEPFGHRVGQWMWSWHYSVEEAADLLEEHGYFKVLKAQKVHTDDEEEERIRKELEKQELEEEEFLRKQEADPPPFSIPFLKMPIERSPYTYVVIAQRCEK